MHKNDSIITEDGNMFVNKNSKNIIFDIFTRYYLGIDKFRADIFFDDNYNLESWGIDAVVLHLPGHSKGSTGVLTAENNLICGDLIENRRKPKLYFVDDKDLVKKSLEKLDRLNINEVYPGHGNMFRYLQFRR
jgi:glyoxylase-like metal-dependent hydrolase (beta-lactamase superfamily II)